MKCKYISNIKEMITNKKNNNSLIPDAIIALKTVLSVAQK